MVCLCMIVKNESKIIERCLTSVSEIIDAWCIVDTGSTDGTQIMIKEKLNHLPGKLIERPWINFGHNRTEAINFSKEFGEWALVLDADMVLINSGFDKSQLDNTCDAYYVVQENLNIKYKNLRLLNLKVGWNSIGVTHEYWKPIASTGKMTDLSSLKILDIGDGGAKGDKFTRDIELLVQGIQDEPENVRYKFYLAQSYKDCGHYPIAITWYQCCAEESKWSEEAWYSEYMILCCLTALKKPEKEIEEFAVNTWIKRPWRVEPLYKLAQLYKIKKDWLKCYHILKVCATAEYPIEDSLFIEHKVYEGEALDELSVAAYWIKKYNESIDIINGLMQKRYGSIYRERLLSNKQYSEEAIKTQHDEFPFQKND